MNNTFNIHNILDKDDIKEKYLVMQDYIKVKYNNISSSDYISILDIEYDIRELYRQINNIEYLIFANMKETGGLTQYMNMLNSDSVLTDKEQYSIYDKLFDMVILNKEIDNPLCNCCLTECDPSQLNWMTSANEFKEIYIDDISDKRYESHNYLHICKNCNLLLKLKLNKYYNNLNLIPMTQHEFNKQISGFMKFQTLIFNLLFNYDIEEIKEQLS